MVNLRGSMVPAIDLRVRLGLPAAAWGLQTPMVFCASGDGVVAMIVDEVEDVLEVSAATVQPPSRIYELADMLLGVAMPDNEPVLVLDVDRVIPPLAQGDEAR
jgi:purine-binding chemotaxis protein CheW